MTDSRHNPFASLADHLDGEHLREYCKALERVNLELQTELSETRLRAITIMTEPLTGTIH